MVNFKRGLFALGFVAIGGVTGSTITYKNLEPKMIATNTIADALKSSLELAIEEPTMANKENYLYWQKVAQNISHKYAKNQSKAT